MSDPNIERPELAAAKGSRDLDPFRAYAGLRSGQRIVEVPQALEAIALEDGAIRAHGMRAVAVVDLEGAPDDRILHGTPGVPDALGVLGVPNFRVVSLTAVARELRVARGSRPVAVVQGRRERPDGISS